MKKVMYTVLLLLNFSSLFAQNESVEAEIKILEQREVQAIINKDTVTLLQLWDKNYVVNSPNNVIVFAGKTAIDRPVLKNTRTSFTRVVEQILVRENTVFSMGSEKVVTSGIEAGAEKTLKRRYTNIWMKNNGAWKLVARHANVICE